MNGAIHTCWFDSNVSPAQYFYDWSSDGSTNWHSDIQVSSGTPGLCSFRVLNSGDGYFTWNDSDGSVYLRNSTYGNPVVMNSVSRIFAPVSVININGIDLWIDSTGENVFVPFSYESSGTFYNQYIYPTGDGTFRKYYEREYSSSEAYGIKCAGLSLDDPARIKVLSTWIDTRTGIVPAAHIYGNYFYSFNMF
jgi:hypothetical protein